jgi:hypothetical protein
MLGQTLRAFTNHHLNGKQHFARLRATASCQRQSKAKLQRMLFNKLVCHLVMLDRLLSAFQACNATARKLGP